MMAAQWADYWACCWAGPKAENWAAPTADPRGVRWAARLAASADWTVESTEQTRAD